MDFVDLGRHCALSSCKQQDYLPFTCPHCGLATCLDHRKPEHHDCVRPPPEAKTVNCPICSRILPIPVGKNADVIVDYHIRLGCKQRRTVKPHSCSVQGCKRKEVHENICRNCKLTFCLNHRFPLDHNCSSGSTKSESSAPAESSSGLFFPAVQRTMGRALGALGMSRLVQSNLDESNKRKTKKQGARAR